MVARGKWRGDEHHKQNAQGDQGAQPDALNQTCNHAALLPMMPCGRTSSTITRMAKANIDFAEGVNNKPATASVRPISTPPTMAPGMEPRPPVITITKASKVYAGPAAGVTSKIKSSIGPAAPTQAAPSANVSA